MQTRERVKAKIEEKLGFFPPFFSPAVQTPQLLDNLWHQTLSAYINNPLPALFKEKLSAYLSRFCAIPYCLICHSCSLYSLGMQAKEVLELLESSSPTAENIDEYLKVLAAQPKSLRVWSESNSVLETSLLGCSIAIALQQERADDCRTQLRRVLGDVLYQHLVVFIAYVKMCHAWMEAHPEVAWEADKRVIDHFDALVESEPSLAYFFRHYYFRVRQEQVSWAEELAARAERQRHEQTLQEAAAENLRLSLAIASVSDGVLITDPNQPDNPIIYSNPAFSQITGYTADEIIGRNCNFLQGLRTDPQTIAQIRDAIACRQEIKTTLLNYRKNGQPFWNELKISPVFSDEGDLVYFVGIQTDVTERKQAEVALQESNKRIINILESITDGFFALDKEWRFTYLNLQAERLLQRTRSELLGQTVWDKFPEAVGYKFHQQYNKAVSKQTSVEFEEFYPPLNTWFAVHAYPSKEGLSVYFQDITQRKQAEQKIRFQAALLDITTDAILVRDLEGLILFWNQGASRLYGWQSEEILGKNALQLLYQRKTPQMAEAFKTVVLQGKWQGELPQVTKNGKTILVESRWTLMLDEDENPTAILVVNTDITEKKQLEAQFLRAQRLESIGTLASGITHDLNNILTPILASAQLLLQAQVPVEKKPMLLETIESSARRGAALVKQVLSFARGVEGKHTALQMRHLISEIRQIVYEAFPKSIEFHSDISQNLWMVSGDATQLHQVLMNLCVNARDAMPHGGTLTLSATNRVIDESYARMNLDARVGSYVALTVSDTGMGMPPEVVERIFEPFFTTKELGKGTGLGLSTVLTIVKSHGGFLEVTSAVGEGTQISAYLPAIEAEQSPHTEDSALPMGQGELILVVDDEAAIRETNKTSLEAYNYRVLIANDGIEAIALYVQHKEEVELVLVDMMMPLMDGTTTIRTLEKINPQVKIIAVSGLVSNNQLAQSPKSSVQAFLSKPYTAQDLLQVLDEVLRGTGV